MLQITECRTCNADIATCPIKKELSEKLKKAGIKERLKYKCKGWQQHLKYKVGDKVNFRFIEIAEYGGQISDEALTGVIINISKKRPVYFIVIDQENRDKIDNEYPNYGKHIWPYHEASDDPAFDAFFNQPTHYTAPVRESLIDGIAE